MATRKTLTDRGVAALRPRAKRYAHADPERRGHYVRVAPGGAKSFVAVVRAHGKQHWIGIGPADAMPIAEARERARDIVKRVRAGLPAVEVKGETVGAVVANWIARHVEKNGLRTRRQIVRLLDRIVLPAWRDREFTAIRRSDIAALLDRVEDQHGARQADVVLTIIASVMAWYATRHDEFRPPTVRGMRRQSPHAQRRSRVLTDDELRAVWAAAESAGAYGGIVRLCLLTAQRRTKVAAMRWAEIDEAGVWAIPREPREKGNAEELALPGMALAIVRAQPRFESPYVFAARRGRGPFADLSDSKARLDEAAGVKGWRLHDLRRTARSLMARAAVSSEVAERVLGHAVGGIAGTYNRHNYANEKADGLRRLATLIERIVSPGEGVVVPMARR